MSASDKMYMSYNNIHKLCQQVAGQIMERGDRPDVIIAITGGGMIPARIIRSFLKVKGQKNIPIQAIGLSLYEDLGLEDGTESIGKEVIRTQWLDFGALDKHFDSLIGKKVLIVDEVDDTRTTLHYAVTELEKEVKEQQLKLNRMDEETIFSIFVLHNKDKPKKAELPASIMATGRYLAAETVPDRWLCYPWEAIDIEEHTRLSIEQGNN
ncbi:ABL070Cp [Eremothecium gossypii ATCC 10895]|uniref:ABL070Cp n=1 Tax=Eremothecium gossypii (strain ATCC 10895 / CBS 109.51 / FGSC 9923 / NRRL Y-1056) TaxID=284811 RepID=Q75DU3_EREGS|nr:ABL070Cp [Eremothecium gossypii ATCC 10895]AAS50701.2 ABL070Cp [Eremothecium gossypii ATCC 10895]AEY94989.1 FABL070Cp [Eremothecium gossypii FDAG1]